MTSYQPGTRVRFTDGPLALQLGRGNAKFGHKYVNKGETGAYCEPRHGDRWHLIDVGGNYYCPCHETQFEVI